MRGALAALVVSIVLPVAVLACYGIYRTTEAERFRAGDLLLTQSQISAALLDGKIAAADALLLGLSVSSQLERGNLDDFARDMQTIRLPPGDVVAILAPDGQILLNTLPPADAHPARRTTVPELIDIVANGRTAVSDLYRGPVTGTARIAVARPVTAAGQKGGLAYELVYALSLEQLSDSLLGQLPSPDSIVEAIDRRGVIIARSRNATRQIGERVSPTLLDHLKMSLHGTFEETGTDGVARSLACTRASASGFAVCVGMPSLVLFAKRQRTLDQIVLVSALLFLPSLCLILVANRRLTAGLRVLSRVAGMPPGPVETCGIREIDGAAAVLQASRTAEAGAAATLRAINADLEKAVSEAMAKREETAQRTMHAQRLEALGGLASGVAHDFGNVLQVVGGNAALIRESLGDAPAIERSARMLEDVVHRGESVVGRLLAFARKDQLRATDIDVRDMLDGMGELLAHALPKRIRVTVEVPEGLPPLRADRGQLETALLNIATNARDATLPAEGIFTLSARLEQVAGSGTDEVALPPGDYIRLVAADTGKGMSPETLARASEPFFTTKGVGQGTGLGLSMARGLAERSGGGLFITSTPGQGTSVSLWLPCAPAASAGAEVAGSDGPEPEPTERPPRILLLDDMVEIGEALARYLGKRGMVVTVCDAAAAALRVITDGEPVDLLITDLALPDMQGDALVREVEKLRPVLPIIVLTGHHLGGEEFVSGHTGDNVVRLLRKPTSGRDVADAIRLVLRQQAIRNFARSEA